MSDKRNLTVKLASTKKKKRQPKLLAACVSHPSTSLCLDLPPPPEPPPGEDRLRGTQGCVEAGGALNGAPSSLERSEYSSSSSHQRKGSGQRHGDSESVFRSPVGFQGGGGGGLSSEGGRGPPRDGM